MNLSENMAVRSAIEAKINCLAQEYRRHKALILTERDLQCQLYNRLSKIPLLAGNHQTADSGVTGPRVHADLSWFDENWRLSIIPDISILEVDKLSISRSVGGVRLPSKQFSFGGSAIVLEVKFCRNKCGITDAYCKSQINKDIDKIDRLMSKLAGENTPNSLFCYYVVFSKSEKYGSDFNELINGFSNPQCKLIYNNLEVVNDALAYPQ